MNIKMLLNLKILSQILSFAFISIGFLNPSFAQTYLKVEGSLLWQSRNDQRIPGDTGSDFSISDIQKGPFLGYRVYAGHIWNKRHEVRALYAPLALQLNTTFNSNIRFIDSNFAANTNTSVFYKFNSYRLTYAYHFDPIDLWQLALGFTAKIRDAEVRLEQSGLRRSKSNIGFVPLLHFQAYRPIDEAWAFRFDFDGLAAPQGRAFDVGIFIERSLDPIIIYGGYRTVEGGADNKEVYNFAWVHQATLGLKYFF